MYVAMVLAYGAVLLADVYRYKKSSCVNRILFVTNQFLLAKIKCGSKI